MDTNATQTMRACRLGALRRPSAAPGAFRAPQDQAEVARRVAIYTRQVEEHGRITWLPQKGDGD